MSKDLSPPRLARPRLLIVGCGDVGMRCLQMLAPRWRVFAVTSQPGRVAALRAAGAVPLVANLDEPATLKRLHGLADRVLHLAPPPARGDDDSRTVALIRALRRSAWRRPAREPRILPERPRRGTGTAGLHRAPALVYASTSGVYGDRGGARIGEAQPVRPQTARARRRVAAERAVREFGRASGWRTGIVRIPGIYAADRLPVARLLKGTPALVRDDDVYTNHIHADDLARAMIAALLRGRPQRVVHASDDSELRMADYFDLVADRRGLPRPPRLSREQIREAVEPALLSFMSESRRLDNARLKRELRLRLRYPTVHHFFET
ncbi:NAD-dependent epimerase/dehydratase family protein [Cupriavidus gilardii]|uniref:NAD-dependent epimerase/dehydratase family protein n=1 Tax=Cupriavidus gilardii TaxID=82541 RepID=UPI001ABE4A7B|nr:NAD-dependent epimerase/dehydratase family protein [Cupriavidus gilardii]MBO4121509.1 NAD-dependent epimerase/dehydratase family protein [Cupriavidus gilardii]